MTERRPSYFGGKKSAVSLTFDDGMDSHLEVVVPALDTRSITGTFYVKTNNLERVDAFRNAQQNGHEIGNHTVHHWCSRGHRSEPNAIGLEDMTLDEIEAELKESDRRLRNSYPQLSSFSFCYPCYDTFVGQGHARRSYVPVVASLFSAARGGGEISSPYNSPIHADLWCLKSIRCEHMSADQMITAIERGLEMEMWTILTFHGVDEGHLAVTSREFERLLDYLVGHSHEIYVAPLIEVANNLFLKRSAKTVS